MRKKEEKTKVIMPDVVGEAIEDAEKILKEKNIEITEVKKKFDLFTKKDYVIKTEPEVGEKVEDKVVVTISRMKLLPLLLLCILFVFGGLIFGTGTISRVFTTSAPVIESKTHEWTKSGIVVVTKDAKMIDEVKNYEYCVTKRKTTIGCKWEKTETKNVEITTSGVWNVYFRGIDLRGRRSKVSNRDYVKVDNDAPIIDGLNINNNKVIINAYDKHSGIDKIYYSFDGENYTETDKNFDLKENVKTIYIKVVDKVGNETVLSKNISASCDLNCDTNNDGKCDLNCDTNNDGKCDLNCDTNNDGKCDLNCDTNNDGKCDLNCDTDNDGKCDLNCSTDNTNNSTTTKTKPTTTELIDNEVPIINLNKVPSKFIYGSKYDLPSYYKFGPKGGKVKCIIDGTDEKNATSDLSIGKHNIVCTAYGNNGINVRVSKMVEVNVSEGEEETWDGWIRLNLYYPLNSTNWQWRIGKEGEIRNGYDFSGWQDYTGPILVKLEDVKDVYIRYDLLGETYIIAPNGRIAVDIEPEQYTVEKSQKTKVKIYYEKDALTKEYRIGSSDWMSYTGEFEVGPNTLIEARSTKEEKVYNSDGEYLYSKKIKGTDSVFISELISIPGISINPSDDRYYGKIDGGYGEGGGSYGPSQREDGSYITAPDIDFKPSEYLTGPIITGTPSSTLTDKVKINISTKEEAETIYVKIGSNGYQEYTGEFEVTNNTIIYAYYIRKSDGKISDTSYYKVKNIRYGSKPYVRIEANPDYLSSNVNEVTVAISGSNYDTLEYSLDGYIYQKYTGEIKVKTSTTIYAKGTNPYGVTIEKEFITTKNAPASKRNLAIEIFTDPSKTDKLINKTKVSIDYDSAAEKKYYKLAGDTEYKEYTGPFEITKNTTVYAYATSKNGVGYKEKGIDFLTTGIMAPIITVTPSTNANMVKVSIEFDKNANKKYYQIDNGEKLYYTGEFEIYENSNIYAYNSNSLGYEADSLKEITNVNKNLRYYVIDKGKYFIIKLNYPSGASVREYKWKKDGVWKNYEDIGILLIKPEYKDEFNLDGYDGIKVEDENGNDVIFTDHYYLIDVPFSKLMENLFMRWDKTKPVSPEIMIEPDDKTSKEVKVIINYSKSLDKKYYKLVNENGDSTDWISYDGPFNVSKNGVIIYAKGETYTEIESEIVSRKITNIDNDTPVINVNGDFDTPKQKLNLLISVTDKSSIDRIKYAKGNRNIDYFKNNGNVVDNFSNITIDENGEYTIYAIDELGNATVKVIKVSNIDKDAPNIEIVVKAKTKTIETEVEINYGDSVTKQYKIGETGEYKEYTDILTLKSSQLYNLKNQDGSLTIYAKGTDEAGNEREVKEITYVLDLDEIIAPILNLSDGYPMLTRDGMLDEKPSYISYDTKDDIENTYKIDDEEYKEYTGPITAKTGKIIARSERKSSGQVVETTGNIVVPTNAIGKNTYDKDLQTSETIGKNTNKIFTINSSLYGEKVKIYTGNNVSSTSTIKLYDKDKTLLDTITTVSVVTIVEFKEDTYFVEINAGSAALEIKEIELIGERYVNNEYTPIIGINESKWAAEKIATIEYYSDEYQNEYSLDNGTTWNTYEGPIKLIEPTNVMARTTRDDEVLGSSNFIIIKIDTEEPVIELNIGNKIQLGYEISLPTYYKETPSGTTVECKDENETITNTSELKLGNHKIVCTAKTGAGKKARVEKTIQILEAHNIEADSILKSLESDDLITGKYKIQVDDEVYPVHVITLDGNQHFTENQTFGDDKDVATATDYAQNMVIVKVNGDLEIDSGVTVSPYYTQYGGPKGFTIYVTGKLINNGTIDNSHGAKAEGQNVYLWKNTDGSYEYVPAEGAAGGLTYRMSNGQSGTYGQARQTGGGGAGGSYDILGGAGGTGTSYSGGPGGGGSGSEGAGTSGSPVGGAGGNGHYSGYNVKGGGGAGNPGGAGYRYGSNGTGGLLTIYANEYENNGTISAHGYNGGNGALSSSYYDSGGSSGGGSINIFTNENTRIDQLGIITNTRYDEIKGNTSDIGGVSMGSSYKGGAGGNGTVNIGEIRKGQYYDLKEIIEQDKNSYIESVTIKGDSILSILNDNDLKTGYYYFVANGENYPVHLITLDGNQHFTENQTFGDDKDVATATDYAQNMVIVKVNGDLEIDSGVTVSPYYTQYGGPKGFTIYVTGKLTNNGTIDNSHGAKAEEQNVYLWKNTDGTYEYVPAVGGAGGAKVGNNRSGLPGTSGLNRQTGGGGSGGSSNGLGGTGGTGTSYSGGSGGGAGGSYGSGTSAEENGGSGGKGTLAEGSGMGGGGAGNPGGTGYVAGQNGTGGLLTIYASEYENRGTISAKGSNGGWGNFSGSPWNGGGSSGAGSINIFYINKLNDGTTNVNGGVITGSYYKGGAGGTGTVTYTQLSPLSFTLSHTYPNLTESKFEKETNIVTINYSSTLKDKLYSLDDGNTWLNYKKPFAVNPNDKILAKGINKDGSETEVIAYTVPETDGIPYNAYDGTTSEKATLEANKDYIFTVSSEVEGRNLRFFLGSEPSEDASIKVYDKSNKEVLSTTFVNNLTVINIPKRSYKFVINGGSKKLTINEINLREEKEIINEIPVIETNDTGWSVEKIIDITYPEGYEKEYSLDLGKTWNTYESPITIEKETIIFARTKKDGKVVTTNSYIINKIDTTEPIIELEIPEEVTQNDSYEIPTKVTYGKSEGIVVCKANEKEVKNTNELEEGENTITCTATSGSGKTSEISKKVTLVKVSLLKDTLLSREIITTKPTLTTSSNNTEDASGLYKSTETNSGEPTYYFRGDVQDNYVSFAGQTWRIVRINEDGTIRLIMQNGINDNQSYVFNSNYSDYSKMYYSNSEAKTTLENWYNTNIGNNENYSKNVVNGSYFCEQAKVKFSSEWTSGLASMEEYTKYIPTSKCEMDGNGYGLVNSSIGLLTYDEAVFAGGYWGSENHNYYLNNQNYFWTLSPAGYSGTYSSDWTIYPAGSICDSALFGKRVLRPVINLKSDTNMIGSGTIDDPYVVK